MDRDPPILCIEDAWPLYPGDLPSERDRRLEPALEDLEHNPVFRVLLLKFRSDHRVWGTEFFSPSMIIVLRGSLATVLTLLLSRTIIDLLIHPRFSQHFGGFYATPLWGPAIQFILFAPLLPLLVSSVHAFRTDLGRQGTLAGLGVPEPFLRGLLEMPHGPRLIACAWWGLAVGRRRLRFLRATSLVLFTFLWAAALFALPLVPGYFNFTLLPRTTDYLEFPLTLFFMGFVLTLVLVSTACGPHVMMLGLRAHALPLAQLWREALRPLDILFLLARRPGDLLGFTGSMVIGLFMGAEMALSFSAGSYAPSPPTSWVYAMLLAPVTPLAAGTLAGLYWGLATAFRCRRDSADLLGEIEESFRSRLEAWTDDEAAGPISPDRRPSATGPSLHRSEVARSSTIGSP